MLKQESTMNIAATIASFSTAKKLILGFFSLILFYFGIQLIRYHYLLVTFPYPLESFEGAMLLTTNLLLKGENPYALENMPVAINVYGINYHLLVYPFARIWGSTFLVHRAISAIFILLSCILFFIILRRHQVNVLNSFSAVLILYASLLYRYTAVAKPDGLGLFLFLLSIFIVSLMQYSTWSLVVSVVLGVLAFYTKPYFVLSIPYLVTYLFLFVSKKKAIFYGVLAFVLLITTAFMINQIFETYFVNTFFNHINVATNDFRQLTGQLELFSIFYSGIILIFIVSSSLSVLDKIQGGALQNLRLEILKKELINRINVFNYEKPFLQIAFPFSLYCFILSFGVFYFKLGRHVGNIMTYAYHLITPFFLLYVYSRLDVPLKSIHLIKRRDMYHYVILLPGILVSLYLLYSSATYLKDSPEWTDMKDWERVEQIMSSYKNIMNSQVLVSLLLEQNKPIYDTGQTEFFQYSHYSLTWLDGLLLPNADISRQWTRYEDAIGSAVREEEFDAIIVTPLEQRSYLQGFQEHYVMVDKIGVCMFHTGQCALLEVWEPKSSMPQNDK
ncbi:MAG TPA: hypothetical protein VF918_07465 [Anaerolineales bacterium]